ncbi:MAG TPA: YqhR family membrane protein, partial [Bacilli bacterium]
MHSWSGHLAGWAAFIGFSILAALLYAVFCHKLKGPFPGILYGLLWWEMMFLWIGPMAGMFKRIPLLEIDTALSELCVFTLWGVFIGYTLTVEFTDERIREPKPI